MCQVSLIVFNDDRIRLGTDFQLVVFNDDRIVVFDGDLLDVLVGDRLADFDHDRVVARGCDKLVVKDWASASRGRPRVYRRTGKAGRLFS